MTFSATMHADETTMTITLTGDLDRDAAPELNDLVIQAASQGVQRLVLLMRGLQYMSSAGLRCLVFAHQKMPRGTEIVLVGTQAEVAETIRLTGFDRSITMEETAV